MWAQSTAEMWCQAHLRHQTVFSDTTVNEYTTVRNIYNIKKSPSFHRNKNLKSDVLVTVHRDKFLE